MISIPTVGEPFFKFFSQAFTRPTYHRAVLLAAGLILTFGRHTITGALWTLRDLAPGHSSTYHRIFSRARWSLWVLGKILTRIVVSRLPTGDPILVAVDDTTAQHRGKKVYGKGRHHDAVRSTHSHVVWRWGHRWVVLAILVPFPFARRPWALPVLVALYKSKELNTAEKHRHKTVIALARQLIATLIRWFPDRHFVVLGDGGYASHEFARFCHRHRRQVTLISRFCPKAALHDPPAVYQKRNGRPRIKGRKLPSPQAVVQNGKRIPATATWYGGSKRKVEFVSGTGQWFKTRQGLVSVRWVFVHDRQGTHRDEYFYTTDPTLTGPQIIGLFTARWSIETTFQEMRSHLGFETTKQRTQKSILRMAPVLLGLFTAICLIFARQTGHHRPAIRQVGWYTKAEPTFADAMVSVRRLLWREILFKHPGFHDTVQKLQTKFKIFLLEHLSAVA